MHRGGPSLSSQDERLPGHWIDANKRVLEEFQDGDIEYAEDAVERIVPI